MSIESTGNFRTGKVTVKISVDGKNICIEEGGLSNEKLLEVLTYAHSAVAQAVSRDLNKGKNQN